MSAFVMQRMRSLVLRAAEVEEDREFLPAVLDIMETPPTPLAITTAATICTLVVAGIIWACVGM